MVRELRPPPPYRNTSCPPRCTARRRSSDRVGKCARKQPKRYAHCAREWCPSPDRSATVHVRCPRQWDRAWVVDAGHCVIQVRQVGRARIEYRRRFLIGAVGVRDGRCRAWTLFRQIPRTGQLCCHVRDTDEPFGKRHKAAGTPQNPDLRYALFAPFFFSEKNGPSI